MRLYRGEKPEFTDGSQERIGELFPAGNYVDVPGLCRLATIAEIEAQGWSLNPGRYVGTETTDDDDGNFTERLSALHAEFTKLSGEADALRSIVDSAVSGIVGS